MVQETVTHRCTRCGSEDIVRNGTTRYGKQQYKCKSCGRYSVLEPSVKYTEDDKEQMQAAHQELRGQLEESLSAMLKKGSKRLLGAYLQYRRLLP